MKLTVKLTPESTAHIKKLQGFPIRLTTTIAQALESLGARFEAWTKESIYSVAGRPGDAWVDFKSEHEWDERAMLASYQLVNAVKHWKEKTSFTGGSVKIGFKPGAGHTRSGWNEEGQSRTDVEWLAMKLEAKYGSVFEPTVEKHKDAVLEELSAAVILALRG
jgi:hypothetical protein